jgi:PGF-CTERM protein
MGLAELIFGICRNRSRLEMYDVNFGGIEQMTKRLTIALVALAMFVLVAVLPVSAVSTNGYYLVAPNINQGATVFIGEQGLNITQALATANAAGVPSAYTTIGWWASAADIQTTAPTVSVDTTGRASTFTVTQSEFDGYEGQWYLVASDLNQRAKPGAGAVFNVKAPKLDITIRDPNQNDGADVSGKSVPTGSALQFQIGTNMYTVLDPVLRNPVYGAGAGVNTSGYLDIVVKTDSGAILTALYNTSGTSNTIKALNVSVQPFVWGRSNNGAGTGAGSVLYVWDTAALTPGTNEKAYPAGTYTVSVVSKLNNMNSNYLSGAAAYTGRTVSETKTTTLVSDTVSITANKDTVVRTKPFSVTIVGRPSAFYNVWIKSTKNMNNAEYDNGAPIVTAFQDNVIPGSPITDAYLYQNGGGRNVTQDSYGDGTNFAYAQVKLSTSGTRTVEFTTTSNTKAQKFTIRVESNTFGTGLGNTTNDYLNGDFKGDEVDVKVEKGAVTIVAAGDQSYYLGEEIKLSGTNTESTSTYLFIIGPNLPANGGVLTNPKIAVIPEINLPADAGRWNSVTADVLADNTWSYKWGTSAVDLDAGTYTIYAVSKPYNKDPNLLSRAAYGTVSIIIKKPFVSATASQSTVAQGDKIFITGTAEGQPSSVAIWILGKNFATKQTETVNSDGTFRYEVKQDTTKSMYSGQYFVVVQHPMMNGIYDIDWAGAPAEYVYDYGLASSGTSGLTGAISLFKILGSGSLQGSDAAEALVQGINQPYIDDTYTKLQFLIEQPIITIVPIGDKHVGDKFTITSATNLAVDDEILVQVYSSSFKPTQKSQSGEFSGATGTVRVQKGETGLNKILFDVDSSTFKPDEYIVTEDAVIQEATGTALFNVLEGPAPTPVVTTMATPVVTSATTVPTAVPTTAATPTPQSPGYGALIALIGLGAVAFIVVRRH